MNYNRAAEFLKYDRSFNYRYNQVTYNSNPEQQDKVITASAAVGKQQLEKRQE